MQTELRGGGEPIRVGLVGCGYWGPNLIRNFASCPATEMAVVCDRDPARLRMATQTCPGLRTATDFRQLLEDPTIGAVVIATPPQTHAALARAALQAGKHVLVEKPLTTSLRDAEDLVRLACDCRRTLMVDHTYIYSPAVQKIKELLDRDELGELYYLDSVRINLGLFQNDVNVLWDLAVHDLAIADYLLGREALSLSAFGTSHTGTDLEDVAYLNLDFGEGLVASFHVNWLSPVKVRYLILGGSKKGLVFNDLDPSEPIKVYDRGITVSRQPEERRGVLINYRMGDVWSPRLEKEEPLRSMVNHFAECVRTGDVPRTDGHSGLRLVRLLDLAQRSIKAQGEWLPVRRARLAA